MACRAAGFGGGISGGITNGQVLTRPDSGGVGGNVSRLERTAADLPGYSESNFKTGEPSFARRLEGSTPMRLRQIGTVWNGASVDASRRAILRPVGESVLA